MMSMRPLTLMIPAALALASLTANASPLSDQTTAKSHQGISKTGLSDVSAAQKKNQKKKKRVVRAPAPQPQMWGWGGWKPADPSFDQNGRPYQPPPGLSCPVDLGYGRWGSCDDDY
jgi:hypothetical protein